MKFGGLDNRHDPAEVTEKGLVICANIDHRNDGSIVRRRGFTQTSLTGTALHSLWGSEDTTYGYVADGSSLYHLNSSLTKTLVGSMPSSNRIFYADCGGTIALVTSSGIRFVVGTAFTTFSVPTSLDGETSFMDVVSGWSGNCAEYSNGRLYVGVGSNVQYSKPYNVGVYDTRHYQLPVGFVVKNIFNVESGLWVCGDTKTVFLQGSTPEDYSYREILDFGVFSGCKTIPQDWGVEASNYAIAVNSTRGVLLLQADGTFVDISNRKYYPPVGTNHSTIIRDENGYRQLLNTFTRSSDGDVYIPKTITIDSEP